MKAPDERQGNRTSPEPVLVPVDDSITTPAAPAHLEAVAAAVWDTVWLAGAGFYMPAVDSLTIERYSTLAARRAAALDTLRVEGETTIGSTGQIVIHPTARLLDTIESKMVVLEDRLGLNPAARLNLGMAVAKTTSSLDKYLAS